MDPHDFSCNSHQRRLIIAKLSVPSHQFDTCPKHFDLLTCQLTKLWRYMSGHVRTKSVDFAIYRIWVGFIAFWRMVLSCIKHNWCLLMSRSHMQLLWGEGNARSRLSLVVSVSHFSRFNSSSIAILSIGVIV